MLGGPASVPVSGAAGSAEPGSETAEGRDAWVTLILILYVSIGVLALSTSGVRLTQEDGFYYLKIAERLAAGEGSSFDGLSRTNGYHPLWLLCLVPVFWLTSSPEAALTAAVLLQGALLAVGAALLYRTARFDVGTLAASLAAILWLGLVYALALAGLEFALHSCLLLSVTYAYRRWFWPKAPTAWPASAGLGLLLGLTFLARLETLVLAGVLSATLAWQEARPGRAERARVLALVGPLGLVCLGYAVVNLSLFGLAVPVSSLVKSAWSQDLLLEDPRYLDGGFWAAKARHLQTPLRELGGWPMRALLLGSVGAALGWRLLRPLRPYGPFIAFSIFQVLGYGLSLHGLHSFARWYYAIQPILAALLVAAVVDWLARRGGNDARAAWWPLGRWVAVVAWCAVPLATLRSVGRLLETGRGGSEGPLYVAARWARENLPAEARIGTWNAGAIGFLSRRRVVNLDGLVNSREYFERDRHDLCRYWDRVGLTHLLDVFSDGGRTGMEAAPKAAANYRACADRLELLWEADTPDDTGRTRAYRIRPRPEPPPAP